MEGARFHIATLNPLRLTGSGHRREIPIPAEKRAPNFEEMFDFDTLWYDAIADPKGIRLICPKLLNLRHLLKKIRVGGRRPYRVSVRAFSRHDEVVLHGASGGGEITLDLGGWAASSRISEVETGLFAGLNASIQLSRNNELQWIADWARWHVAEQGLQAMVLVDNGSTDYAPEDLRDALRWTGLEAAVVLSAPLPFGPPRSKQHNATARYLQPAMFNLARRRFLSRARAVLVADIDELVWKSGPKTAFDHATASPVGATLFGGTWRTPAPRSPRPARHADHTHLRSGGGQCPTKYAVRPGSLAWAMGLDAHKPGATVQLPWLKRTDLGYWHCQSITTDWKGHKRLEKDRTGPHDASTAAAFDRVFGAPPRLPGARSRASLPQPAESGSTSTVSAEEE